MSLRFRHETLRLGFRDPFRIARAMDEGERAVTVIVDLWDTADGAQGPVAVGEGFPDAYYGETPETIAAVLPLLVEAVEPAAATLAGLRGDPDGGEPPAPDVLAAARAALAAAGAAMDAALGRNGAAKCAVDIALHDLAAGRLGLPLVDLLGLSREIPATDFTLGIDEPAVVAERAVRAARFPALKVKVGGPADLETLEAVRAVYSGRLRVDANTGWQPEQGARLVPELVRLGVELVEQPFPAHRLDQLAWLQERSALPIVADESAVSIVDLDGLRGIVAGVNVKLAKCGGVGAAARMLARARELGFRTFLGCMEETSVGIAASAAVASLAEWVDLDGCLLIADEPFEGLELDDACRWQLGDAPGLGVSRRLGRFESAMTPEVSPG
ncbi:MAG TPA: enolase C-terminal domain-like protein [Candidatus Limnocylindrales bacterium]